MNKASFIYHHSVSVSTPHTYVWEQLDTPPFNELIVSWNALRPARGVFRISISLHADHWTPCCHYSSWGNQEQRGGSYSSEKFPLQIDQDIISLKNGNKATGFRIYLEGIQGADLHCFFALHACLSSIKELQLQKSMPVFEPLDLKVLPLSQILLPHPRCRDMCSPTSTCAVLSYILGKPIDPINFALQARDEAHDIFGNWVLNIAQASAILGKEWHCWVQRLHGLKELYDHLQRKVPVVVSVKGPLPGSAQPYKSGHLMVVKGIQNDRILCMDPAFPSPEETNVSYKIHDFLEAWARRNFVAYLFRPAKTQVKDKTQTGR